MAAKIETERQKDEKLRAQEALNGQKEMSPLKGAAAARLQQEQTLATLRTQAEREKAAAIEKDRRQRMEAARKAREEAQAKMIFRKGQPMQTVPPAVLRRMRQIEGTTRPSVKTSTPTAVEPQ
jgi:hypothetical protein